MEKKKICLFIAIVAIVGCLVFLTLFFINNKNNSGGNNTTTTTTAKKSYELNKVTGLSVKDYENYLSLVENSNDLNNTIYKSSKVTAVDFSSDILLYNMVIYLIINNKLEYYSDNYSNYIPVDQLISNIKKVYGVDINTNGLPEDLAAHIAQSASLYLTDINNGLKVYELASEYGNITALGNDYISSDIIYDKLENDGNNIYVYVKKIINDDIDWSDTGWGSISKKDGSGTIEFTEDNTPEGITSIKELYKKYPSYFTSFKHTFTKSADGSIKYISTEPIN